MTLPSANSSSPSTSSHPHPISSFSPSPSTSTSPYSSASTSSLPPQAYPPPVPTTRLSRDAALKEEQSDEYDHGGYRQILVGDTLNKGRYRVVRKLGFGHFSTVWLVKDERENKHVALKVVKSMHKYAQTAIDEIALLSIIQHPRGRGHANHPGRKHIDPAYRHVCITFEPLGETLLTLLKRLATCDETLLKIGLPTSLVQQIIRQVLLALDFLHSRAGLVHTDLKLENVLVCAEDVEEVVRAVRESTSTSFHAYAQGPRPKEVVITGSAPLPNPMTAWGDVDILVSAPTSSGLASVLGTNLPTPTPTPKPARERDSIDFVPAPIPAFVPSPISDNTPATPSASSSSTPQVLPPPRIRIKIADLGNATPITKHFTPDIQTRPYRAPEVILGYKNWDQSVDIWSVGCMVFELLTSDLLFAAEGDKKGRYSRDDDHMAQIMELLGDLPWSRKWGGRFSHNLFNSQGTLRRMTRLRPWSLRAVLEQKYDYPRVQAEKLKAFMEPMLALDPADRPSAGALAKHPWLDDSAAGPSFMDDRTRASDPFYRVKDDGLREMLERLEVATSSR
ncbi:kinase-like protein [Clavulina sp. PMI_390]|nr:kinase-like protein [Clavulina sp. PMI_390]